MRPVLLSADGKPLLVRNDETNEVFEIGEMPEAAPWPRGSSPIRWSSPIDDPYAPLTEVITPRPPWDRTPQTPRIVRPLAKPGILPVPEIVRPAPQIVPVHGLGDFTEREQHETRSRAMHRLGVDVPVDDVKRRRREEALRRLKDPPPAPDIGQDVRAFLNGLRSRPVM